MDPEEKEEFLESLKQKDIDPNSKLNFGCDLEQFEETDRTGEFEGYLVKYDTEKLAKGMFRFSPGSMKVNEGEVIAALYHHNERGKIPVGAMVGHEDEEGFKIKAKLDLSKDDEGKYINQEAAKLYSLMTNMGDMNLQFELSAGGRVTKREIAEDEKMGRKYIYIKEFKAREGSIVIKGAVDGAKIENVFSDIDLENNKGDENNMDPEEIRQMFQEELKAIERDMFSAKTEEELQELAQSFEDFEAKFDEAQEEIGTEFEEKFESINEVIKTLKSNYTPTEKEYNEAEQIKAIFEAAKKDEDTIFSADQEFAAQTSSHDSGVKPTFIERILERIQEANPVLQDIEFMSITDNSLFIPREMLGLPDTGWVGEDPSEDPREETDVTKLDDVEIDLHQLYALPVVSNKFLATNFVQYLPFLMRRVEYALSLALANAVFNGTGDKQPLGILQDENVNQEETIDLTTGGDETEDDKFADKIIDIYYSVRSEIASQAKWYMRRETWAKISKLKNERKDFYITDLNDGNQRTLMTRPVEIVESDGSGLKPIETAENDEHVMVFGDFAMGMQGIQNNNLNIRIEDRVTTKGFTKYYLEKLLGAGVQLPERFVKIKVAKDTE
ncbi:phage major capsid protein [Natroniella sp. ANB-PHB2]|uniref:phage major capsid protein n=1 Tax=Natroniella sp. ANB-PHB2 TaxID=3384444 RepID=UPI0038D441DE